MLPQPAITYSQPSDWVRQHLREDFSMSAFAQGQRVLDVGCGYGRDLDALREAGIEAVGVDPDPAAVDYCATRGLSVTQAPAESLPFPDASFDGVVLDGALQFTSPALALAEAARVLRPGGTLLLATQGPGYAMHLTQIRRGRSRLFGLRTMVNGAWYAVTGQRLPGWLGDTLCFTPGQVARLCEGAGFTVVEVREGLRHWGLPVFLYLRLSRRV